MYVCPKYRMGRIYAKQVFCCLSAFQMFTGHPALLLPTSGNIRGRNKVRKSFSQILPPALGKIPRREEEGGRWFVQCLKLLERTASRASAVGQVRALLFFAAESGRSLHLLTPPLLPRKRDC